MTCDVKISFSWQHYGNKKSDLRFSIGARGYFLSYQICMGVWLSVIEKALKELEGTIVPHDTVIDELRALASEQNVESEDLAIAMAAYMLGFGSYKGFNVK